MSGVNSLPESAETYWRWGLASLVLAIISIVLVVVSQLLVDPNIPSKYERIVEDFLVGSLSTGDQIRGAELAAQRLMVRYPQDARYRKLYAQVCFLGAGEHEDRGESELSESYRSQALAAIRSGARLSGPDALWARSWMLRSELLRNRQRSSIDSRVLSELEQRASDLTEALEGNGPDASLGSLWIRNGHRVTPDIDARLREAEIRKGVGEIWEVLGRVSPQRRRSQYGLIAKAWLAEGLASIDPQQAVAVARDAIVEHSAQLQSLHQEPSIPLRIELIDSIYRCLILVSGFYEGSVAVQIRMDQIPQQEQQLLRNVIVASNIRALVSKLYFPQGAYGNIPSGDFFRSSLIIAPDHAELVSVLDNYFFDRQGSIDVFRKLLEAPSTKADEAFPEIMLWMKRIISQGDKGQVDVLGAVPSLSDRELETVVGLLGYWIAAVDRLELDPSRIEPLPNALVEAFPGSGDLKLARAVLAMKSGKWGEAIRELESIQQGNPSNTIVKDLLGRAKLHEFERPSGIKATQEQKE